MTEELVKQALDDLDNGYSLAYIQNRFKLLVDHYQAMGEKEMVDAVGLAWLDVVRLAPRSQKRVAS